MCNLISLHVHLHVGNEPPSFLTAFMRESEREGVEKGTCTCV